LVLLYILGEGLKNKLLTFVKKCFVPTKTIAIKPTIKKVGIATKIKRINCKVIFI
jgi:hypothetical protein